MESQQSQTRTLTDDDRALDALFEADEVQPLAPVPVMGGAAAGQTLPELGMLVALNAGRQRPSDAILLKIARRVGEALAAAGKALYSFPAGGGRVEGATIQLAEELARGYTGLAWSVLYDGIDDDGRVVLRAIVVDAIAGVVVARPHVMYLPPASGKFASKADQAARWESMQVQSAISKAIRTTILHALPGWYVAAAENAARNLQTRNVLNGEALNEALAKCVSAFAALGIEQARIEAALGSEMVHWTVTDLEMLRSQFRDIKSGRLSAMLAFPPVKESPKPSGGLGDQPAKPAESKPPESSKPTGIEALRIQAQESEEAKGAPTSSADLARWRGEHGLAAASLEKATEAQLRAYLAKLNG